MRLTVLSILCCYTTLKLSNNRGTTMRLRYIRYTAMGGMKRIRSRLAVALTALGLILGSGGLSFAILGAAHADSLTTDFESYTLGGINGQNGWAALGSAGSGCAVYDEGVANNTSGFSSLGAKSFRISNAVTSGCFGDQAFAAPLTNAVGEADSTAGSFSAGTLQRHFEMQFDIASATPGTEQPGLFISVSPDRGDGSRMSYLGFQDTAGGVDVVFYDVQGTSNPANFVETDLGTYSRTAPHTIKLALDALDGPSNDVVKVWIDGTLVHTGTSWENYYRYDAEASAEQSPRIVKTVLFRAGGTAAPATAGSGFLFDNLSLTSGPIPSAYPTSKSQCKNNGWKQFTDPSFKNQGQCIKWVEARAEGDLRLSGPKQRIEFQVANAPASNKGHHDRDDRRSNTVEYTNYDYPGGLHYKAAVTCAYVNPQTDETRFMFQIPAGHPGLSGLYVVAYAKEQKGKHVPDLYGHAATADLATATQWCQTGAGFAPTMYPVVKGHVEVE